MLGFNNRVFNSTNEPYYINYDEIYAFAVESDFHHATHFQLVEDVPDSSANKGFLDKRGDWFDVFAPLSEFILRLKAYDLDETHIVVHCHYCMKMKE